MQKEKNKKDKTRRLTYYLKENIECPLCQKSFRKEELHKSGGRMISGDLTDELHRIFMPSTQFGAVYPLIYPVTVCSFCLYASFPQDFLIPVQDPKLLTVLRARHASQIEEVRQIIPGYDFSRQRTLKEGVMSYLLALFAYELFPPQRVPAFKQALCCLRASWLCQDFHKESPEEHYNYLKLFLVHKARFLYNKTLEYEEAKKQPLPPDLFMGPDLDKNYGFDGIVYLTALLEHKYGNTKNLADRLERLKRARFITAKLFGLGRSSKSRPSAILDRVKDLHDTLGDEVVELELAVGNG